MNSPKYFVGIDLGTTNTTCTVGLLKPGEVLKTELLPIRQLVWFNLENDLSQDDAEFAEESKLPSSVWLRGKNEIYTGRFVSESRDKLAGLNDSLVVPTIKSEIGNTRHRILSPGNLDRVFLPYEIASYILMTVWQSFRYRFDENSVERITITIPASFSSTMRTETLKAIRCAGIPMEKVILVDEPVAALLSDWDPQSDLFLSVKKDSTVLVYDLGGGTIDVSIIKIESERKRIEVKSCSRFNDIGGTDIDLELAAFILTAIRQAPSYNQYFEESATHNPIELKSRMLQLLREGEKLKFAINLALRKWKEYDENVLLGMRIDDLYPYLESNYPEESLSLDFCNSIPNLAPNRIGIPLHSILRQLSDLISSRYFEQNDCSPHLNLILPVKQALDRAKLHIREIRSFFAVGGGSNFLPLLNEFLYFFSRKASKELDPDFSISNGAAKFAFLSLKKNWTILERTNECVFLKRSGYPFLEIFPSNQTIPNDEIIVFEATDTGDPLLLEQVAVRESNSTDYFLSLFQGERQDDPFLRPISEKIKLSPTKKVRGRLQVLQIRGKIDPSKIFHFKFKLRDIHDNEEYVEISLDLDGRSLTQKETAEKDQLEINRHQLL